MTATTEKVLEDALELPPVERAVLVEQLLTSFELPQRKSIDELWAAEAENRIDAYDNGLIKSTPAKDIFAKIK